ncbi:ATP-dependent 6-phosphofructokinase [Desulfovibrio sp. Huiquan2017]|uniref:ATP-dependent 6-phosphofructokinase n=1 Tax=Desulfovibrio sp. Huiquan2017 TaxID=2816861 RepID=UPI001A920541|nr:ATP-dependent 6-phosphofructokinase [Desulfovibrio sp. Huiquan2017]
MKQFDFITEIPTLGKAKIKSPLRKARFVDGSSPTSLMLTSGELTELDADVLQKDFEKAGPREHIYFDAAKARCAIVTCGGICPGINDVIRAIVHEAHYHYGVRHVLGITNGLRGFIPKYGYDIRELTPDAVSHIHQFGGTILGSSRGLQDPVEIVDSLERLNINVLFVIGGDGAMRAAKSIVNEISLRKRNIAVIGIPKTIDNDINFITRSFGFDTAVEKAAEVIQCAHVEATGMDMGVGLVKLMGREAGFIAAQATLAMQEVNFLLVPEQPFALTGEGGLLQAVETRLKERKHSIIVCAEGAGQDLLGGEPERDPSGNPKLGDICGRIVSELEEYARVKNFEVNIKFIDPSYLIRSVPANASDRVYCGFLGQNAVHAAMAGKTGMVVSRLKSSMVHLPLDLVATKRRHINTSSDWWASVMEATGQRDFLK